MSTMTDRERSIRQRLKDDFDHYAAKCLKLRTKQGEVLPFVLNSTQRRLHDIAEEEMRTKGRVRLIILKFRQPGTSTYVQGRFYWKTTHRKGVRAFILTHRDQATANLFAIGKRFHENCPPLVKPLTKASNATELDFSRLDSGYRVGTAKAAGVGRSDTIQYFHGSEVAFWASADEHAAGVLQAIPKEPNTESWLESTANGVGGLFYGMCNQAMRGEGEYRFVFLKWYEHEEYRMEPPADWTPPEAFVKYQQLHGLDDAQLYWMFVTNAGLAAAESTEPTEICWRFRQEYPATPQDAFRATAEDSFIQPDDVLRARNFIAPDQRGMAMAIGCDFARGHRDRNVFMDRLARSCGHQIYDRFHSEDTEDIAGRLARRLDEFPQAHAFLDSGGGGAQVYDILRARNYGRQMTLVNFGGEARDSRKYANKRAEMYGDGRDWLRDVGGADLPDDDVLEAEITAAGFKYNANQQIVLEKKDDIRKRTGFSPDGADAWALTFAEPLRPPEAGRYDTAGEPYNPLRH